MVEKLKLISKQIHWSSVLKAAIFALAWFFLPFWLFLLIALYLYFFPLSQSGSVAVPFLVLLFLCLIEPSGILFTLVFGTIFFYILVIKDLLVIDRKSAYEILVFALSFLTLRSFYDRLGGGIGGSSLLYSFLIAIVIAFLVESFWQSKRNVISWLLFMTIWQLLIAGLFLPVDFVYQAVIIFLALVIPVDLIPQYLSGDFIPEKIFAVSSAIFAALVIVLASAHWGL